MSKRTLRHPAIAVLTSLLFSNAYAVAPGFYMGIMGGPATNDGGTQYVQPATGTTTIPATPKSSQFGSRLYMGYKINQYGGMEGGLTYFSGINYDTGDVPACSGVKVRVRDIDFVGKGSIPIGNSFEAFGKAGVGLVYVTTSSPMNPDFSSTCGNSNYSNKFKPVVSIGANYTLTQNWVAEASWTRIMVSSAVSNVDLYALGISYHFVETYCGQFIC